MCSGRFATERIDAATSLTAGPSSWTLVRCWIASVPTARSSSSAASRPENTSTCCCRSSAIGLLFPKDVRWPRRHEPGRPDAAIGRWRPRSSNTSRSPRPRATGNARRGWSGSWPLGSRGQTRGLTRGPRRRAGRGSCARSRAAGSGSSPPRSRSAWRRGRSARPGTRSRSRTRRGPGSRHWWPAS